MMLVSTATAAALLLLSAAVVLGTVDAYNPPSAASSSTTTPSSSSIRSRRSVLAGLLTAVTAPMVVARATEDTNDSLDELVYFGVGCFWHIQHELVQAERDLLQRNDATLTALTGYAGGKAVGSEGRVCYHNLRGIADYGKLGHGEVVGLRLPQNKIVEFSKVYFGLFNPKTGGAWERENQYLVQPLHHGMTSAGCGEMRMIEV